MPATNWAELSAAATPWLSGFVDPSFAVDDDFYIDFLFDGGIFLSLSSFGPTTYAELSISSTPSTELTGALTPYIELSL